MDKQEIVFIVASPQSAAQNQNNNPFKIKLTLFNPLGITESLRDFYLFTQNMLDRTFPFEVRSLFPSLFSLLLTFFPSAFSTEKTKPASTGFLVEEGKPINN